MTPRALKRFKPNGKRSGWGTDCASPPDQPRVLKEECRVLEFQCFHGLSRQIVGESRFERDVQVRSGRLFECVCHKPPLESRDKAINPTGIGT